MRDVTVTPAAALLRPLVAEAIARARGDPEGAAP